MTSETGWGRRGQMYRNPWVRYGVAAVALWIAYMCFWGLPAKWRTAPSLQWATHTCHIPFAAWGVLFILYAALLMPARTRPAGFLLGWVLFAFFTVALLETIDTPGPKSAFAIGGFIDICIFHAYAVVQAMNASHLDGPRPRK